MFAAVELDMLSLLKLEYSICLTGNDVGSKTGAAGLRVEERLK